MESLAAAGFAPVVVLADRCTDGTVGVASAAGAECWTCDGGRLGKSALLSRYLPEVLERYGSLDAVAVVDADNRVEPSFGVSARRALAGGALVLQGRLRTLNGADGFWPSAIGAAYEFSHWGSQVARMGWGAAMLGGTGMVFSREALSRVPFVSRTLTEDIEYTLLLWLAGVPVVVLQGAVLDEKPRGFRAVLRQRWRWMSGQLSCMYLFTWPLVRRGALDHLWVLWSPVLVLLTQVLGLAEIWLHPSQIPGAIVAASVLMGAAWLRSRSSAGVVPPWWGVFGAWLYSWVWLPAILGALLWPATVWKRTDHVGVRS